jgi:hypothetical protein
VTPGSLRHLTNQHSAPFETPVPGGEVMPRLNRRSFVRQFSAIGGLPACPVSWADAGPSKSSDWIRRRFAEARPVPHSLLTSFPGKVHLDLWGWETTPWYQRAEGLVVSPEYVKRRAVDESYKWGANLVEVYRGGFPLTRQADWTRQSTAELNRHIHERDMVVHWFPHRLDGLIPPVEQFPRRDPHGDDEDSCNTFSGAIDAVLLLAQTQLDCLTMPVEELLDGFSSEQWPTMPPPLLNKCLWPFNPSMYVWTDNHAFDETLPNEIDVSGSNGLGSDDQTTGYYKLHSEIRKRYGLQFWASQAECRTRVPKNMYGGFGYPDWVLKQANDQFRARARARGSQIISPTALWWINEAEDVCPEENRRYVYGVSQDPIRCAVTARFTVLGEDGLTAGGRKLPQRYPYPSRTAFIQNNHLMLTAQHDQDRTTVWHDPERLAHYDDNSYAVPLCDVFGQTVRLADGEPAQSTELEFNHVEPAGYKSVLQTRLKLKLGDSLLKELRTFVVISDTPYFRLRVERTLPGSVSSLGTRIGLPNYDLLVLGQILHKSEVNAAAPDLLRVRDSSGVFPDLVIMILEKGHLARVHWEPGRSLVFESEPAERDGFELALVIPGELYAEEALPELHRFLSAPEEKVALDGQGQADIANVFDIPLVKVIRVTGAGPHPYQLREFDRWVFRGAQPSLINKGEDYLKCYLRPRESIRIQRYGFIEDVARPGWGCQYTMAVRQCVRHEQHSHVVVEVNEITSFLFAPRLRFRCPVARVRLDSKEWHYFDGCQVFLPNRRGLYDIVVDHGPDARPHLARTFADIRTTNLEKGKLEFEARLPEWVDSTPDDFLFTALVRHPGQQLVGLTNAELFKANQSGASVITFKQGNVSLAFDRESAAGSPPRFNQDVDIEEHLSRLSARMMQPYVDRFSPEYVSLKGLSDGAANLAGYDVLVWNHYFLDSLPPSMTAPVVEALRRYVEKGGGLFLIANAVRLLPPLAGIAMDDVRTNHIGHHLDRVCEYFGIEAAVRDHPIFQNMRPAGSLTGCFPLIRIGNHDIFKRVLFELHSPAGHEAKILGLMRAGFKPGNRQVQPIYESSPVLWECPLGKGSIIAYTCGVRCSLGSPNRWIPEENENSVILARNILQHLGHQREHIRVGVLS